MFFHITLRQEYTDILSTPYLRSGQLSSLLKNNRKKKKERRRIPLTGRNRGQLVRKRDREWGFARQTLAGPRVWIRTNGKLKAPIRWRNAAESAASGSVIQKIQKYIFSPLPHSLFPFCRCSLRATTMDCSCCSSRRVFRKSRRVSRFRLPPLEAAQCLEIYENFCTIMEEKPLFVVRRCIFVWKKNTSVSPCRNCSNKRHIQEDLVLLVLLFLLFSSWWRYFVWYVEFLCCTRISRIVTLRFTPSRAWVFNLLGLIGQQKFVEDCT